ncbi:esterase-like activity of phytase family protein [Falsirhodobacter sp. 20TX0035]|uniref:esterase-like activity of phytase family protein n=1 Tax=Falsirhodobacter sp. 20TX0035 TaxID=3022019 RepID=UPI00232E8DEF|nr:esterase-like activity of phytase family protein [Falsirhodobacter sp. 20TX0035]MDB6452631.1 esterase-like activity of phytase family protein [Falsirhodobacter sp. 20TX0035]
MLRRLARTLIALPLLVVLAAVGSWQLPAGGQHAATFRWHMDDPRFGGFSSLRMDPDGRGFTTITDKGDWLQGTLIRDGARITGVTAGPLTALRNTKGDPVARAESDSEGFTFAPDGGLVVTFEQRTGLRHYPTIGGVPTVIDDAPFQTLPFNAGLESLAFDGPDLLTIPEAPNNGTFTVWRLHGTWRRDFAIHERGIFRVADADVFEDHLYILERAFFGFGFSSRVRRFDLTGGGEVTLLTSRPGKFDNLEGLSVWRDGAEVVLTMISDDNFMPFERTEFVEYRFPD